MSPNDADIQHNHGDVSAKLAMLTTEELRLVLIFAEALGARSGSQ